MEADPIASFILVHTRSPTDTEPEIETGFTIPTAIKNRIVQRIMA
jgi:hypothetical protein